MLQTIEIQRKERSAWIWLNRPKKRNALNNQMVIELITALDDLENLSEVRSVILSGKGDAFCAGLDLEIFLFPSENQLQEFIELAGSDPRLVVRENAVLHFPICDATVVEKIVKAISS